MCKRRKAPAAPGVTVLVDLPLLAQTRTGVAAPPSGVLISQADEAGTNKLV
jgi:hypothetical protein